MSGWQYHGRTNGWPLGLDKSTLVLVRCDCTCRVTIAEAVVWSEVDEWRLARECGIISAGLRIDLGGNLRQQRDAFAESLYALRHRIAAVIRDPSTPDPERRRLVSLLSGVEFDRATETGEERQDRQPEHQKTQGRGEADCTGGRDRAEAGGEEAAEEVR